MSLSTSAILTACMDHAASLGKAERVLLHEPKSKPGKGITIAIWVQSLTPTVSSGLASTSARLEISVRVMANMLADPQDAIDAGLLDVVDALMAAYTGDFTLGGLVRQVDVLGAHGDPLAAEFGYLTQDNTAFRVAVITLPLIVNDPWEQAP